MGQYDDIIHLPHHVSPSRPRMSMAERGAQFSSFAALSGFEAAIQEAGRLTDSMRSLNDEEKAELDRKYAILQDFIQEGPELTVTYFVLDAYKIGGSYVQISGILKKIDLHAKLLVFEDGTTIQMDTISSIESYLFESLH